MRHFLEDGVRQRLHHVTAGRDVDIWEMTVTTTHGSRHHCPPTLSWLMLRRDGRVQQLRVVYPKAFLIGNRFEARTLPRRQRSSAREDDYERAGAERPATSRYAFAKSWRKAVKSASDQWSTIIPSATRSTVVAVNAA